MMVGKVESFCANAPSDTFSGHARVQVETVFGCLYDGNTYTEGKKAQACEKFWRQQGAGSKRVGRALE